MKKALGSTAPLVLSSKPVFADILIDKILPEERIIARTENPLWLTVVIILTSLVAVITTICFSWKKPYLVLLIPVYSVLPIVIVTTIALLGWSSILSPFQIESLIISSTGLMVIASFLSSLFYILVGLILWIVDKTGKYKPISKKRVLYGLIGLILTVVTFFVINTIIMALGIGNIDANLIHPLHGCPPNSVTCTY